MKALVLVGPTAAGKTDLSLTIARDRYEIVSADSVQVYRFLNIGAGKPAFDERKRVEHHLIDVVDPDYPFSAGDFVRSALTAAQEIEKRKKIPFFVGGTGLYIDSFFKGLSDIPEIDLQIRREIEGEIDERGASASYEELLAVDPEFAARIHPADRQRIVRGLEVFRATGKPISYYHNSKIGYESEDTVYIGLNMEREILKSRIEKRVDSMIEMGFVDEVRSIRQMGYEPDLKSMRSIGYADINRYIDGEITLDEAIAGIKQETKRYAKRQMTWFRKNKKITWFEPGQEKEIFQFIDN
ncbi:MAG: tRNA (adenosine(37)-N6)-dimethylallyltransferase MiaA [bacterium]|nr:tRNA (adenosine(37)-N6)-dimethylallyltransferase MiaA [bacterium]